MTIIASTLQPDLTAIKADVVALQTAMANLTGDVQRLTADNQQLTDALAAVPVLAPEERAALSDFATEFGAIAASLKKLLA